MLKMSFFVDTEYKIRILLELSGKRALFLDADFDNRLQVLHELNF